MTHFSMPGRFRRRGLRDSVFPVSELLFEHAYTGNALRVIGEALGEPMVRQAAAQRSPDSATQALQRNAGVSASVCPGVPGALPGCFWLLRLLLGRPGNAQGTPGSRPARRRLSQPGPTTLFMKRRWLSVLRGSCGAWGSPGSSWLSLAASGVLRAALGDPKHAPRTTAWGSSQNDSQQRDFKHSARRRKNFLGHRVGSQA